METRPSQPCFPFLKYFGTSPSDSSPSSVCSRCSQLGAVSGLGAPAAWRVDPADQSYSWCAFFPEPANRPYFDRCINVLHHFYLCGDSSQIHENYRGGPRIVQQPSIKNGTGQKTEAVRQGPNIWHDQGYWLKQRALQRSCSL